MWLKNKREKKSFYKSSLVQLCWSVGCLCEESSSIQAGRVVFFGVTDWRMSVIGRLVGWFCWSIGWLGGWRCGGRVLQEYMYIFLKLNLSGGREFCKYVDFAYSSACSWPEGALAALKWPRGVKMSTFLPCSHHCWCCSWPPGSLNQALKR